MQITQSHVLYDLMTNSVKFMQQRLHHSRYISEMGQDMDTVTMEH